MLIYRAINKVNNKSYVGKTEKSLDTRKEWHYASVRQKSQFAFHRAIAKYGQDAFEWQVLDTANTLEELNNKEQYYIQLHEAFGPHGYNMTSGGEGQSGWNPSEKTRQLWSQQRKGIAPWNKGMKTIKAEISAEEKLKRQEEANIKRSAALKGRKTWNNGLSNVYATTVYKVIYKDGTEATGTRLDLGIPRSTINTMFRDKCGSRKYNIQKIERS